MSKLKYIKINKQLTITPFNLLDIVLSNRNINNVAEFINPNISNLECLNVLDNINKAYDCLIKHITLKSKIAILYDCDVDGFTSGALMYQYIKNLNSILNIDNIDIEIIVHSDKHHGLTDEIMEVVSSKFNLLIIPDAGSSDYKQLNILKNKKIDVIILDHHEAERESSDAIVINNQLSKNTLDKSMTGVGIVYKFCLYIDEQLNINCADKYIDLVAVGMVADMCNLKNLQSRYIVNKGLKYIRDETGSCELFKHIVGLNKYTVLSKFNYTDIAFSISPFINALIRLGTLDDKKLLADIISGNKQDRITSLIEKIKYYKEQQEIITDSAVLIITRQISNFSLNKYPIIVANFSDCDYRLTGLIANKIKFVYDKPCVLLYLDEETNLLKGSGRGLDNLNGELSDLKQFLKSSNLFHLAEGHSNSLGVQIHSNKIFDFYKLISNIPSISEKIYMVDEIISELSTINSLAPVLNDIKYLWCSSVKEPVFAIKLTNVSNEEISVIGKKEDTLKIQHSSITFIKFKCTSHELNSLKSTSILNMSIIGTLSINEFKGKKNTQVIIKDFEIIKDIGKMDMENQVLVERTVVNG